MAKESSDQEKLCHEFLRRSAGAAWCFVPDRYYKGKNRNEKQSADLAWRGIGCVVLFYLKQSETRSVEQLDEGNFGQAYGWLRAWRSGTPLKGRNRLQELDIPFDPTIHVVVLSVVACQDQRVKFQSEYAKQLGVTMAATITEGDFSEIAASNWTIADLIYHLNGVRLGRTVWNSQFVANRAALVTRNVFDIFGSMPLHPQCIDFAFAALSNLRLPSEDIVRIKERLPGQLTMSLALCDLTLGEWLSVGFQIAIALSRAAPQPLGLGWGYSEAEVTMDHSFVRARAYVLAEAARALRVAGVAGSLSQGKSFSLDLSFAIAGDGSTPTIHPQGEFVRGSGLSNVEWLLNNIAADSPQPPTRPTEGEASITINPRDDDIGRPSGPD